MTARIVCGDATALPLPSASVDAIVCDPPYGLEFMGKDWDAPWKHGFAETGYADGKRMPRPNFGSSRNPMCRTCRNHQRGTKRCVCPTPDYDERPADANIGFQRWCELWTAEAFRVLKPGGYLLAFGGSRTWHRLACAIEDAGFELRDSVAWMYGSGFPKSLDVSKALDKLAGAEREVIGLRTYGDGQTYQGGEAAGRSAGHMGAAVAREPSMETAPATDAARQWQGWGTALKPAFEPIIVARKPLVGTVAQNVTMHGTGALNIDAARVGSGGQLQWAKPRDMGYHGGTDSGSVAAIASTLGRWPPNVVLSHGDCADGCEPGCPVAVLDQQSGISRDGVATNRNRSEGRYQAPSCYGEFATKRGEDVGYGGQGGASRFFPTFRYQAKAPTRERPVGPDGIKHPTCKPLDLMRWLVRLVTPPGGIVLDMFAGSGTTLEAAQLEGFAAIGVEKHAPYLPLIVQRLERSRIAPTVETDWVLDLFGDAA